MDFVISVSDVGIWLQIMGFVYMISNHLYVKKFKFKNYHVNEKQFDVMTKTKYFERGVILIVIGLLLQLSYAQLAVNQLLHSMFG